MVTALCGVLPAFRAGRETAGRSLTEGTRTQVSSRHALQWWLVGAQVAMSVVLLAGAGLLVRSVQELGRIDAGFDPTRVLTFRVSGDFSETVNYDRLIARIEGPSTRSARCLASRPPPPASFSPASQRVRAHIHVRRGAERRGSPVGGRTPDRLIRILRDHEDTSRRRRALRPAATRWTAAGRDQSGVSLAISGGLALADWSASGCQRNLDRPRESWRYARCARPRDRSRSGADGVFM